MTNKSEKKLTYSYQRKEKNLTLPSRKSKNSRIGIHLVKAITYDRQPELFDTKETRERDEQIRKLNEKDKELNLQRKGKPVFLSPLEARIVFGCAYQLGQHFSPQYLEKIIQDPLNTERIYGNLDLNEFSKFLFNSSRSRVKDGIRRVFQTLHSTFQVQKIKLGKKGKETEYEFIEPLITFEKSIRETTNGNEKNLDIVKIGFGRAFFLEINKHWGILTPKLFEVWSKGKKSELFHVLLSSILSVYWQNWSHAKIILGMKLRENNNLPEEERLTPEQVRKLCKDDIEEALTYPLSFSNIKKRVTTDYDSIRQYKSKFKKDLLKVIKDLTEAQLITNKSRIARGKKEEVVYFVLNFDYIEEPKAKLEKDKPSQLENLEPQ